MTIQTPSFSGELLLLPGIYSPQLDNTRHLLIYVPQSYHTSSRRYPVIYMHDGQNLFDPATAYTTHWRVGETMGELEEQGHEAIIVGIPNMCERRIDEYGPFETERGGGDGRLYLDFIVETVKPFIDEHFRTLPDQQNTGILGSSMGGLISLYALLTYPEVFGFIGAMSPSLWFGGRAIFPLVEQMVKAPVRIYIDAGTCEGGNMVTNARAMTKLLRRKGYKRENELLYVEDEGAAHCEEAWACRLARPLTFWLEGCTDAMPLIKMPVPALARKRR